MAEALPDALPDALIVAHGQPGDPAPQQAITEALAARVQVPGIRVRGATLAMSGALDIATDATLIYPLFMAQGWFTRTELPRRLALAGASKARILPPFGADPGNHRLQRAGIGGRPLLHQRRSCCSNISGWF